MSDRRKPSAGGISGDADLAAALARLERASRDRFAEDWALYFGAMPRTSRALLLRAVAQGRVRTGSDVTSAEPLRPWTCELMIPQVMVADTHIKVTREQQR